MEIKLNIDDREVREILNRLQQRAEGLTPAMQAIGAFYERSVVENPGPGSPPDGTPWKPLAEATEHLGLARHRGWKKNGYLSAKGKRYLTGKRIL